MATVKRAAIVAWLVLFLTVSPRAGAATDGKEAVTFQATAKPLPSQQVQSNHQGMEGHSRPIRRTQSNVGWAILSEEESPVAGRPQGAFRPLSTTDFPSADQTALRASDPLTRGQWDPIFEADKEPVSVDDVAPAIGAPAMQSPSPSSSSSSTSFWRDNELTSVDDSGIDDRDANAQQLNWHEAQLARLHGLGPAEIAALSTWQHRLKINPLPNRVAAWHHQPPPFSQPRNLLLPLYGKPTVAIQHRQQQVVSGFDSADINTYKLEDSHQNHNNIYFHPSAHKSNNQTRTYIQEPSDNLLLLPLWPKRSADTKKSERENKNRNAAGRKEKTEPTTASSNQQGSTNPKNTKSKNSRKQQQQQQHQQHQHQAKETSHRPTPGVGSDSTVPSGSAIKEGVVQHQHGRSFPGSSSSSPDVSRMNRNLATQFLLRSPRENRQYDVPIIGKSLIPVQYNLYL